jgi:hypothetical protein
LKERQRAGEEIRTDYKFNRQKEIKNMFEAIRNIVRKRELIIDVKSYSFISFYEGFL